MKGIVGATFGSTGIWLFVAGICFHSPLMIVLAVVFFALGCWVLFGPPVPGDYDD